MSFPSSLHAKQTCIIEVDCNAVDPSKCQLSISEMLPDDIRVVPDSENVRPISSLTTSCETFNVSSRIKSYVLTVMFDEPQEDPLEDSLICRDCFIVNGFAKDLRITLSGNSQAVSVTSVKSLLEKEPLR